MTHHTHTNRLEAFSDAVIAIIITIMVIELRPPEGVSLFALQELLPLFFSYILSFSYLAIYWNNHHHLLRAAHTLSTAIMWKNMFLLFWLSLIPFATAWLGEHPFSMLPSMIYGTVLLCAALSYFLLQQAIVKIHGKESELAKEIGKDIKGKVSLVAYLIAIIAAATVPALAYGIYILVAIFWFIPDRRLERAHERL